MIFTHNCTLEKTNKERKSEDYGGEKNEMKYSLYCIEGRVVGFPSPFYVMRSFITICSLLILPIDDRINPRSKYRTARKKVSNTTIMDTTTHSIVWKCEIFVIEF